MIIGRSKTSFSFNEVELAEIFSFVDMSLTKLIKNAVLSRQDSKENLLQISVERQFVLSA